MASASSMQVSQGARMRPMAPCTSSRLDPFAAPSDLSCRLLPTVIMAPSFASTSSGLPDSFELEEIAAQVSHAWLPSPPNRYSARAQHQQAAFLPVSKVRKQTCHEGHHLRPARPLHPLSALPTSNEGALADLSRLPEIPSAAAAKRAAFRTSTKASSSRLNPVPYSTKCGYKPSARSRRVGI